jgi:hypothetical protein
MLDLGGSVGEGVGHQVADPLRIPRAHGPQVATIAYGFLTGRSDEGQSRRAHTDQPAIGADRVNTTGCVVV